jgi:Mlc titration factor MtfA (ptsG expression regulator)
MFEQAPELYRVLQEYYRQNPYERVTNKNCREKNKNQTQ